MRVCHELNLTKFSSFEKEEYPQGEVVAEVIKDLLVIK